MGWSIPTYAGVRATGKPSNYRVAMFELIRAINERKIASQGEVGEIWKRADGSLVSEPTMEDLEDLPATDRFSPGWYNISRIHSIIYGMIGGYWAGGEIGSTYVRNNYFKPDLVTPWTLELIEEDIGMSVSDPATKINEARWWQAMQDALDRLTIIRLDPGLDSISAPSGNTQGGYLHFSNSGAAQIAWDRRSDTARPGAADGVGWSVDRSFFREDAGFDYYIYGVNMTRYARFQTSNLSVTQGEIVKAEMHLRHAMSSYAGPFSVSVDDQIISFSGNNEVVLSSDSFVSGSETTINMSVTQTEPSTIPFSADSFGYTNGEVNIALGRTYYDGHQDFRPESWVWLDMSSILSDQT